MQVPCPKCDSPVELTEVGAVMEGVCKSCHTPIELARQIHADTEVGSEEARKELDAFLADLRSRHGTTDKPAQPPIRSQAELARVAEEAESPEEMEELLEQLGRQARRGETLEGTGGTPRIVYVLGGIAILAALVGGSLIALAIENLEAETPEAPPIPEAGSDPEAAPEGADPPTGDAADPPTDDAAEPPDGPPSQE